MRNILFNPGTWSLQPAAFGASFGLLILRLALGGIMAVAHGWGKLSQFSTYAESFPDPLHVGSSVSLSLTIGAEFCCAILLAIGLMGRLAAVPLAFTMGVAFFVIHGADEFKVKELALVYLAGFVALAITGPGRFSVDAALSRKVPQA